MVPTALAPVYASPSGSGRDRCSYGVSQFKQTTLGFNNDYLLCRRTTEIVAAVVRALHPADLV
jgi:hypothetical protein